jgi:predicted transcriptional regulator
MNEFIYLLIGIIIGSVLGWITKSRLSATKPADMNRKQHELKNERKEKILRMIAERGRVMNDEVEFELKVSDAAATIYLQELEKEGKIIQNQETGRGVFYTRIKG